jgi:hypothetical protein
MLQPTNAYAPANAQPDAISNADADAGARRFTDHLRAHHLGTQHLGAHHLGAHHLGATINTHHPAVTADAD